ncbi:MAG: hypothetical protein Ta2C_02640 [Candidatus Endomicrobiellum trichonymphae]|nr:MAG: hypothetical protein Ta2C_02640 [Candidatus Endomicrobium trichonymphae]
MIKTETFAKEVIKMNNLEYKPYIKQGEYYEKVEMFSMRLCL